MRNSFTRLHTQGFKANPGLELPNAFSVNPFRKQTATPLRSVVVGLSRVLVPPLAENKSEDHESRFVRGGLGMILQSRRYTATLRTAKNLDWDVAPLPSHKQTATVLHADAYCLAKTSQLKDAAYRFIEFALNTQGATIIAKSGRTVPALKSVAESPAFLDPSAPPRSARVFLDSILTMRRPPNIATWNEIETRVDPIIEDWYFSETPPQKSLGSEIDQAVGSLLGAK